MHFKYHNIVVNKTTTFLIGFFLMKKNYNFIKNYSLINNHNKLANNKGPVDSKIDQEEFLDAADYVNRILAGEILLHRVRLDISRVCSYKCRFCCSRLGNVHADDIKNHLMSFNTIQELISQFVKLGVKVVNLYGGGEPTLNPNFDKTIQLLNENRIKVRIITNGAGITSYDIDNLVKYRSNIDLIRFSVQGVSRSSYEEVTGCDLFDKLKETISELVSKMKKYDNAPKIGVYIPVSMDLNKKDIIDFIEYADKAGVNWIFFREDTRFPSSHTKVNKTEEELSNFPEVQKIVNHVKQSYPHLSISYIIPIAVPNATSRCYFQLTDLVISPEPNSGKLIMVRCERNVPQGLSRLPNNNDYHLIEPSELYAACKKQLHYFIKGNTYNCPSPSLCYTFRRNKAIERILLKK